MIFLVLYTDGVTEAMNSADEEFGRDRLAAAVKDASELGARELVASMQPSGVGMDGRALVRPTMQRSL